jgi:hypothetical protein
MITRIFAAFLLLVSFQALAAPTSTSPSVSTSAQCDLPVCNIPETIAELEKATPDERFKFIVNLRSKFRQSENLSHLENLRAFSKESKALSIRLKDEDWLILESDYLSNQSVIGLLKIKRPLEKSYLLNGLRS